MASMSSSVTWHKWQTISLSFNFRSSSQLYRTISWRWIVIATSSSLCHHRCNQYISQTITKCHQLKPVLTNNETNEQSELWIAATSNNDNSPFHSSQSRTCPGSKEFSLSPLCSALSVFVYHHCSSSSSSHRTLVVMACPVLSDRTYGILVVSMAIHPGAWSSYQWHTRGSVHRLCHAKTALDTRDISRTCRAHHHRCSSYANDWTHFRHCHHHDCWWCSWLP